MTKAMENPSRRSSLRGAALAGLAFMLVGMAAQAIFAPTVMLSCRRQTSAEPTCLLQWRVIFDQLPVRYERIDGIHGAEIEIVGESGRSTGRSSTPSSGRVGQTAVGLILKTSRGDVRAIVLGGWDQALSVRGPLLEFLDRPRMPACDIVARAENPFRAVGAGLFIFGSLYWLYLPFQAYGIRKRALHLANREGISLVVLAIAIAARYAFHLRGAWRHVYVVCAGLALYLNVFVGVVQAFLHVPALSALAPQQREPPFVVAQGIVLVLFVVLTIVAAISLPWGEGAPAADAMINTRGFAGWLTACWALAAFAAGADEKTLRVGMDTRSPPWSFVAGLDYSKENQASHPAIGAAQLAKVQGLDVDVARLVAKRLGMKLQIVPTAWASLESGLVAGRYDAIIDAWTRTPQTPPTIAATSPYALWGLLVVVRAENSRVQSWQGLKGMRVGHYHDPAVAQSLSALGGVSLQAFDDPAALFAALKQADLDAATFDSPFVDWWMSRNPGFRVVGEPLNRVGYHIGVRKTDAELARKLEEVARSLHGSPEMAAIRKRWGGQDRPALDDRP